MSTVAWVMLAYGCVTSALSIFLWIATLAGYSVPPNRGMLLPIAIHLGALFVSYANNDLARPTFLFKGPKLTILVLRWSMVTMLLSLVGCLTLLARARGVSTAATTEHYISVAISSSLVLVSSLIVSSWGVGMRALLGERLHRWWFHPIAAMMEWKRGTRE